MLDLDPTAKIGFYALVWLGLLMLAIARGGDVNGRSVGLPLAFILAYTFVHGGALVHLIDGYEPALSPYLRGLGFDRLTVALGLEASCLAMIGASVGFILADKFGSAPSAAGARTNLPSLKLYEGAFLMLTIGAGITVLSKALTSLGLSVAGTQAAFDSFRNLYIVGACSYIYYQFKKGGQKRAMIVALLFALATPAFLLITTAILADSVTTSAFILCFNLTLRQRAGNYYVRNAAILTGIMVGAFIFAGAYLQSRQALRSVVWGNQGAAAATETAVQLASNFDVDSIFNNDTLALIDGRLDQNIFVGLAIQHLNAGSTSFENGATLALAMLGWVPRFVWPDKPQRGGSNFLSKYTGIAFSAGTTFGAGAVFEMFVNYGYPGVLIGFVIFGALVRKVDIAAFEAIRRNDLGKFVLYLLVGIVLLAPLADFFFIVTSAGSAALLGAVFAFLWKRRVNTASRRAAI